MADSRREGLGGVRRGLALVAREYLAVRFMAAFSKGGRAGRQVGAAAMARARRHAASLARLA